MNLAVQFDSFAHINTCKHAEANADVSCYRPVGLKGFTDFKYFSTTVIAVSLIYVFADFASIFPQPLPFSTIRKLLCN